jgi:hypothetical protein
MIHIHTNIPNIQWFINYWGQVILHGPEENVYFPQLEAHGPDDVRVIIQRATI